MPPYRRDHLESLSTLLSFTMKLLEEITPCLNSSYILVPTTISAPITAYNCNPGSCRWRSNHLCPNYFVSRLSVSEHLPITSTGIWFLGHFLAVSALPTLLTALPQVSFNQLSALVLCLLPLTDLKHLCNSNNTLIQRTLLAILLKFNFSPGLSIHVSNH